MKNQLTGILLAGLMSATSLADSTNILKEINASEGYNVTLSRIETERGTDRVTFVEDKDTHLRIVDSGLEGLTSEDYLTFDHSFSNEDRLCVKITYTGRENYLVESNISSTNNPVVESRIDTRKLNSLIYFFIKMHTRSSLEKTENFYANFLEGVKTGQVPDVHYAEIKTELKNFEAYLPEAKKSKKKFEGGLIGLARKYVELTTKKGASSWMDLLFSSYNSPSKNPKNN